MKKVSFAGLMSLAVLSTGAFAKTTQSLEIPHVPGEVIVKVKSGMKGKFLAKKSFLGAEIKQEINLLAGDFVLLSSAQKSASSLVASLNSMGEVEYAEPNLIYKAIANVPTVEGMLAGTVRDSMMSEAPNDPLYDKLWGLKNTGSNEPDRNGGYSGNVNTVGADVGAEAAWKMTKGSKNIVVAVIDTGVDYNHPDLKNNMWVNEKEIPGNGIDDDGNGYIDDVYGWNAQGKNGNPMDGNAHGTHCAGTIGAEHNNALGVAGVMGDVSIMAVKFLSDQGGGTLADAVVAIDYATKMNVDIMSNSWGGGGFSATLHDAIKAARDKGIIFVAAAGNENSNNDIRLSYPASYSVENVVSVASHTAADALSSFSNFGKRNVHIAAPGTNILSTTPRGEYKVFSGTSMATPHVSGVIGLLYAEEGRLPVEEVRNRLMATSVPKPSYRNTTVSGGRVDAYNLLTDTRLPRPNPDENAWRVEALNEVFETPHPYLNNSKITKTYHFPDAKYVKLIIERYDLERNYDFLTVKDGSGMVMEKLTGQGLKYETDFTETGSITVEFTSDSSQTAWGVEIREAKVIY